MNHQTVPCKHCRFENRPDTNFCAGCGTRFSKGNRLAMVGKSIFRKSVVRNGIILAYAATPILIAVWIYTVTNWTIVPGSSCSGTFICGENIQDIQGGFVLELMLFCFVAAGAYLLISFLLFVTLGIAGALLKLDTNPGMPVLVGTGIGTGTATIILIVCCVVGYFLVGSMDWEKLAWSRNALHQAWDKSDYSAVTLPELTEKGADVDARDRGGRTLLHYASYDGEVEAVRTLIKAGADVNARDSYEDTPLLYAVNNGSSEALSTLIDAGADVNARKPGGVTPLHYALSHRSSEAVRILIDRGADVNASSGDSDRPLSIALPSDHGGSVEALRMLIDAGADVNPKTEFGRTTPLRQALYNGRPEAVRMLIDAGADVNAKDYFGETPLDQAHELGASPEILQMLIDAGAKSTK